MDPKFGENVSITKALKTTGDSNILRSAAPELHAAMNDRMHQESGVPRLGGEVPPFS